MAKLGRPADPLVERRCERCATTFWKKHWQVMKGEGQYCSRACYHQARREQQALASPPQPRSCPVCSAGFWVGGSTHRLLTQEYCSRQCRASALGGRPGTRAQVLSPLDAAYLAGFIDGEGSIMLYRRAPGVKLRLLVTNTKRVVLDWIRTVTGVGSVTVVSSRSVRHNPRMDWHCDSQAAESVIEQIRPYLKLKMAQADLALRFQERRRVPALKADPTWQEQYRQQMQALNRRGPAPTPGGT